MSTRARRPHPLGFAVDWAEVPERMPRRDVAFTLLAGLAGSPAGLRIRNPCPRCGGPHGPVVLEGTRFRGSVAYAGRIAVAAVVSGADIVGFGIDAEPRVDAVRDGAGWEGVPGPGRRGTVREWTRVEAVLKADGRGLGVDPADVVIRDDAPGTWWGLLPHGARAAEGWDVDAPAGLVVSAAIFRQPSGGSAAPSSQR
ncbi:4'-phosphopantetheinyl transferase [Microbacterium sp. AK009]|uniref:chemotaxis protein CheY n=1 Tax=Microbacterium sp. AK009 TaxID=2723068 RepID=UPI0017F67D76|nr:chemotaxis protein CheY [Microbacterium sp. AK009]NYF17568.1 4'-phosphopantetheinyl transferase [Microbacterium sp. AK009]